MSQTTAIALPERVPALLRIYDDLMNKFANMVLNTVRDQTKKGQRIPSIAKCRAVVEEHLIWDPKSPGVPLVGRVAFEPEKVHLTYTLVQKTNHRGEPIFDKEGNPVPWLTKIEQNGVTCQMELPGSRLNPHAPKPTKVVPVFTLSGMGGLMPYATVDEQNALRMVPPMQAIFVKRFNIWTGEETGGAWMIPLGIAELGLIDSWNNIVDRLAAQGAGKKWESIDQIVHAVGYRGAYLDLMPSGTVENEGLVPSWSSTEDPNYNQPDGHILGGIFGKIVKVDRSSQPIVIRQGKVPEQRFTYVECLSVIRVKVLGLPEEIGTMEGIGQTLDHGDVKINALELFGVTLDEVTPRSGTTLIRNGIQNPPIDRLIAAGLVPPECTHDLAVQTIQGMRQLVIHSIESTVMQALKDIVHNLSTGGTDDPQLSLTDMLGGEPTGEILGKVLEHRLEVADLLMTAILASQTAGNLGLSVFNPKCWVTNEAWRTLLLKKAKEEGIELPTPTQTPTKAETPDLPKDGGQPTDGASAAVEPEAVKPKKRGIKPRAKKPKSATEGEQPPTTTPDP
jgi:hypothetical protein